MCIRDSLTGGSGKDILLGGSGDDILIGGSSDDMLYGGSGNDSLYGNDSKNTLAGGDGNDLLVGGSSDDLILVGTGDEVYTSYGHDTIFIDQSVLAEGGGEIVVKDFNVDHDTLQLEEGLSISDVIVGDENGDTQLILTSDNPDAVGDDVVVKLLGVNRVDFMDENPVVDTHTSADTLIEMMINSAGDENG